MSLITCHDLPPIEQRKVRDDPKFRFGEEVIGERPGGNGWWWIKARRKAITTAQSRSAISRAAEVDEQLIDHAGARDREADVIQWFSVPQEPVDNPGGLKNAGFRHALRVLEVHPAGRAITAADVSAIDWRLRLHPVDASDAWHQAKAISDRLRQHGGANAFAMAELGPGGRHAKWGKMLAQGKRLPDRVRRAEVSPARLMRAFQAGAFNRFLEARLAAGGLRQCLVGDWVRTGLNRGAGHDEQVSDAEATTRRVESGEAVILGPLLGDDRPAVVADAADFEQAWLESLGLKTDAKLRLPGGLRPLSWRPSKLSVEIEKTDLMVTCRLPPDTRLAAFTDELLVRRA